jgi:hypothetical protein
MGATVTGVYLLVTLILAELIGLPFRPRDPIH